MPDLSIEEFAELVSKALDSSFEDDHRWFGGNVNEPVLCVPRHESLSLSFSLPPPEANEAMSTIELSTASCLALAPQLARQSAIDQPRKPLTIFSKLKRQLSRAPRPDSPQHFASTLAPSVPPVVTFAPDPEFRTMTSMDSARSGTTTIATATTPSEYSCASYEIDEPAVSSATQGSATVDMLSSSLSLVSDESDYIPFLPLVIQHERLTRQLPLPVPVPLDQPLHLTVPTSSSRSSLTKVRSLSSFDKPVEKGQDAAQYRSPPSPASSAETKSPVTPCTPFFAAGVGVGVNLSAGANQIMASALSKQVAKNSDYVKVDRDSQDSGGSSHESVHNERKPNRTSPITLAPAQRPQTPTSSISEWSVESGSTSNSINREPATNANDADTSATFLSVNAVTLPSGPLTPQPSTEFSLHRHPSLLLNHKGGAITSSPSRSSGYEGEWADGEPDLSMTSSSEESSPEKGAYTYARKIGVGRQVSTNTLATASNSSGVSSSLGLEWTLKLGPPPSSPPPAPPGVNRVPSHRSIAKADSSKPISSSTVNRNQAQPVRNSSRVKQKRPSTATSTTSSAMVDLPVHAHPDTRAQIQVPIMRLRTQSESALRTLRSSKSFSRPGSSEKQGKDSRLEVTHDFADWTLSLPLPSLRDMGRRGKVEVETSKASEQRGRTLGEKKPIKVVPDAVPVQHEHNDPSLKRTSEEPDPAQLSVPRVVATSVGRGKGKRASILDANDFFSSPPNLSSSTRKPTSRSVSQGRPPSMPQPPLMEPSVVEAQCSDSEAEITWDFPGDDRVRENLAKLDALDVDLARFNALLKSTSSSSPSRPSSPHYKDRVRSRTAPRGRPGKTDIGPFGRVEDYDLSQAEARLATISSVVGEAQNATTLHEAESRQRGLLNGFSEDVIYPFTTPSSWPKNAISRAPHVADVFRLTQETTSPEILVVEPGPGCVESTMPPTRELALTPVTSAALPFPKPKDTEDVIIPPSVYTPPVPATTVHRPLSPPFTPSHPYAAISTRAASVKTRVSLPFAPTSATSNAQRTTSPSSPTFVSGIAAAGFISPSNVLSASRTMSLSGASSAGKHTIGSGNGARAVSRSLIASNVGGQGLKVSAIVQTEPQGPHETQTERETNVEHVPTQTAVLPTSVNIQQNQQRKSSSPPPPALGLSIITTDLAPNKRASESSSSFASLTPTTTVRPTDSRVSILSFSDHSPLPTPLASSFPTPPPLPMLPSFSSDDVEPMRGKGISVSGSALDLTEVKSGWVDDYDDEEEISMCSGTGTFYSARSSFDLEDEIVSEWR